MGGSSLVPATGRREAEVCRISANQKVHQIVTIGIDSLLTGTNGGLIGVGRSDPDWEFCDFILRP